MIYFTTLVAAALSLSDIDAVAQKAAAHYQALESQARTEAREEGGEQGSAHVSGGCETPRACACDGLDVGTFFGLTLVFSRADR